MSREFAAQVEDEEPLNPANRTLQVKLMIGRSIAPLQRGGAPSGGP